MSQKGIEQFIGKALADKNFLEDFLKNPKKKVKEEGLDISLEELSRMTMVDPAKARQFAKSFEKEFVDVKQGLFG